MEIVFSLLNLEIHSSQSDCTSHCISYAQSSRLFVLVHVCMRWFWTTKYIKMVQCFNCDTFLFTFQCLSLGGKFHSCSFVFSLFTFWFALRNELDIQYVEKESKSPMKCTKLRQCASANRSTCTWCFIALQHGDIISNNGEVPLWWEKTCACSLDQSTHHSARKRFAIIMQQSIENWIYFKCIHDILCSMFSQYLFNCLMFNVQCAPIWCVCARECERVLCCAWKCTKTNYYKNEAVKLLSIILFSFLLRLLSELLKYIMIEQHRFLFRVAWKIQLLYLFLRVKKNKTESVQISDALMALNKKSGKFPT